MDGRPGMKTIPIASDEQWRELRRQHVGGSEVAALFGEHAQVTPFELFCRKQGSVDEPTLSNERVFWGSILEPAIAQGVASKTGWNVRKVRRYHSRLPELGLGGSLDYEIVAHEKGPGILEIKTADWLVARGWEEGEPPLSYELQLQSYMACTGRGWGCMAVLIGGNELRLFEYDRRPATIEIIETEVRKFWQAVVENKPPKPDWQRDAGTISRLYASVTTDKVIDLSESNRAAELVANYRAAAADEKDAEGRKTAAKAELLPMIGDAERATVGEATISCKEIASTPISYIRKAYRDFRITQKKAKAA